MLPARQGTPLQADLPPAQLDLPSDLRFTVEAFDFDGNTLVTDAHLYPVVSRWLRRPIGFNDLRAAAQAVATEFRERGWIVRTVLPAQDVTEGVVKIEVIESRFAGTRVESGSPRRVRASLPLNYVARQQRSGRPVDARALDRALLLIDDLPGLSVSGSLAAGAQERETALLLQARDGRLLDGSLSVDNAGARTTGEERAVLTAALQSPLRFGDQLRADALYSKGSRYARLGYTIPIDADGWRVGFNGSYFDYELMGPQFDALEATGDSTGAGVELSYPLIRARSKNLYVTAAADRRTFHNEANSTLQSDYAIRTFTLGVAGNLFDRMAGGGTTLYSIDLVSGNVRQGELDPGENPDLGGSFTKVRYSLSRLQYLTHSLSLHAGVQGQYSSDDLDSAERFYLGGPDGVRAYPVNDGGGSRSELASLELRWRVLAPLSLNGFADYGLIHDEGPDSTLRSVGAELMWAAPAGVRVQATWALRLGANPNPGPSGDYHDGSRGRSRWWLTASLPF